MVLPAFALAIEAEVIVGTDVVVGFSVSFLQEAITKTTERTKKTFLIN